MPCHAEHTLPTNTVTQPDPRVFIKRQRVIKRWDTSTSSMIRMERRKELTAYHLMPGQVHYRLADIERIAFKDFDSWRREEGHSEAMTQHGLTKDLLTRGFTKKAGRDLHGNNGQCFFGFRLTSDSSTED